MGLPLWSIVKLFFSSVFIFVDPASLFVLIIIIEIIRMSVLVFLFVSRLEKSNTRKDHETKKLKLLRYVLAGVLATSGICNLIVALTIFSMDSLDPVIWKPWPLFDNMVHYIPYTLAYILSLTSLSFISIIVVSIISIAQILWSIKIIRRWSKFVRNITIIGTTWVILLWATGLINIATNGEVIDQTIKVLVPGYIEYCESIHSEFRPQEFIVPGYNSHCSDELSYYFYGHKGWNVPVGIKIELLMIISIVILIIISRKQNKALQSLRNNT